MRFHDETNNGIISSWPDQEEYNKMWFNVRIKWCSKQVMLWNYDKPLPYCFRPRWAAPWNKRRACWEWGAQRFLDCRPDSAIEE
jgi:hypothetical protein